MANGIRRGDPRGFNKRRSSKFHEGRRTYRPKHCGNNNKDEDNSPKTLNDKNHQASSQKLRQLEKCSHRFFKWLRIEYIYSRRNFGLVRNLIQRIISPNQDDLSYSSRISFLGSRNWVSCQTQSLWLNNTIQCRRLTGGSLIAAAEWTHEGTYLINGFLASISLRPRNSSWIWIRYIQYTTHRNNFMSPPKLAMSMRCLIPLPAPSSHFTSGKHEWRHTHLSPKPPDTQKSWYYLPTPPLGQDMTQGQFLSGV